MSVGGLQLSASAGLALRLREGGNSRRSTTPFSMWSGGHNLLGCPQSALGVGRPVTTLPVPDTAAQQSKLTLIMAKKAPFQDVGCKNPLQDVKLVNAGGVQEEEEQEHVEVMAVSLERQAALHYVCATSQMQRNGKTKRKHVSKINCWRGVCPCRLRSKVLFFAALLYANTHVAEGREQALQELNYSKLSADGKPHTGLAPIPGTSHIHWCRQ